MENDAAMAAYAQTSPIKQQEIAENQQQVSSMTKAKRYLSKIHGTTPYAPITKIESET